MQAVIVNYEQMFSDEANKRLMPGLRALATAFKGVPGILPVNAGLPPLDAFPIANIQITLKDGSTMVIKDDEVRDCPSSCHVSVLTSKCIFLTCHSVYEDI